MIRDWRPLLVILAAGVLAGLIAWYGSAHAPPAPCRTGATLACIPAPLHSQGGAASPPVKSLNSSETRYAWPAGRAA